jgi:hypothetical protein
MHPDGVTCCHAARVSTNRLPEIGPQKDPRRTPARAVEESGQNEGARALRRISIERVRPLSKAGHRLPEGGTARETCSRETAGSRHPPRTEQSKNPYDSRDEPVKTGPLKVSPERLDDHGASPLSRHLRTVQSVTEAAPLEFQGDEAGFSSTEPVSS